ASSPIPVGPSRAAKTSGGAGLALVGTAVAPALRLRSLRLMCFTPMDHEPPPLAVRSVGLGNFRAPRASCQSRPAPTGNSFRAYDNAIQAAIISFASGPRHATFDSHSSPLD